MNDMALVRKLAQSEFVVRSDLVPFGARRRPGRQIGTVLFVVAHDTGNPGASARAHANWYRQDPNPPRERVSSAHLFVDDLEIVETIPSGLGADPAEQAYHVLYNVPTDNQLFGADANSAAIGVELCYGGTIDPEASYLRYIWTLARLCTVSRLDPQRHIVGHHVLDPKRKRDPVQGLVAIGRSYEGMLADVADAVADFDASLVGRDRLQPGPRPAAEMRETTVHLNLRAQPSSSAGRDRRARPAHARRGARGHPHRRVGLRQRGLVPRPDPGRRQRLVLERRLHLTAGRPPPARAAEEGGRAVTPPSPRAGGGAGRTRCSRSAAPRLRTPGRRPP
jgi:hypothetical protein